MSLTIRRGNTPDVPFCAALGQAELGAAWGENGLRSTLAASDGRLWVATEAPGDEAARLGFAVARRVVGIIEIEAVAVSPRARRTGIARSILEALLEAEIRADAEEAQLELRVSNEAAARLYDALGFVVVGRRARYYPDGEDALLLTRRFTSPRSLESRLSSSSSSGASGSSGRPSPQVPPEDLNERGVPIRGAGRVVSNTVDGNGFKMLLEVPGWAPSQPGQFLMLGAGPTASVPRRDPLLPRPMAVYRDYGTADGAAAARIEVLYRVVGRGTTLLSEAREGDSISLVGPLGQGFPVERGDGAALLVGAGRGSLRSSSSPVHWRLPVGASRSCSARVEKVI